MYFFRAIIRNSKLSPIRIKLIWLYLLNVTDIIFTLFLLETGMFIEANFIMAPLVNNNPLLSLGIKLAIPLILLSFLFYRMKKATDKQLIYSNIIITGCLGFYVLVNLSHIFWCILYL